MALGIPADQQPPAPNPSRTKSTAPSAPSAPPLETLPSINDSDYAYFIVVKDNPANCSDPIVVRKIACEASERLRRILNENLDCDAKGNHLIRDVSEVEFRQFIEFLETKRLQMTDQNHRLQMFSVAKQFNCPEMVIYCLRDVDDNLNVSNVLTVYRTLWFYGSLSSQKNPYDSKARGNFKKAVHTPDEYLTFLVYNVLQFINMNAENVLLAEEIEHLGFKEFENIVKQDDLILHSEMVLINALTRWSREECRRRNIELTHENERRVLGELCYAPRYLTLRPCEFELACKNIRYLDPDEIELIRNAFDGKKSTLTEEQSNMLNDFRKPRSKYAQMPIHLSARSARRNYPRKMRRNDRSKVESLR